MLVNYRGYIFSIFLYTVSKFFSIFYILVYVQYIIVSVYILDSCILSECQYIWYIASIFLYTDSILLYIISKFLYIVSKLFYIISIFLYIVSVYVHVLTD